ncbi:MAG: hypothetical protein AB7V62_12315 [Thermoleophilia bacterium]
MGLWVVALTLTLGALAAAIGAPRRGRGSRDPVPARPAWLREPPPSPEDAERRSLDLLRSVVNPEEWEMFRDLGFICVPGRRGRDDGPRYRYLVYPHLPVVALLPRSLAPVREYCVQFPEQAGPGGGGATRLLPVGDDVLAKWMTLRGDEDRLLAFANVAGAGSQVPLGRVERDLASLARWRARREGPQNGGGGDSGGAPGRSSAVSSSILR